jgi:YVTN family beta-propeller protein
MAIQADTVVSTITVANVPKKVAINPAGTFAYVTHSGHGTVSKIDLATGAVANTITVLSGPMAVAINPAGTYAYVVNSGSGVVSIIDLATDTVTTITGPTFTVIGRSPQSVAINPAGTFAYVTNSGSNTVSKIDLSTDTVATTISVESGPWAIAINPAGTYAYVTSSASGTVSKIDLSTDTVANAITVGLNPWAIALNPAGTYAYVTNSGSNTVSKIDLSTDTVATTITVGSGPWAIAINPAGTYAYTTNSASNTVSKINLATASVAATITGLFFPAGVAINPAGTFAYVTNFGATTVSKIAITATDQQSIAFTAVGTQLSGAKTVALSATASSTLPVTFTSATQSVCTVSGSTVTIVTLGECTIHANQAGGSGFEAAPQVSKTFTILPSPPAGETGVSIKNGDSYTNSKQVSLNLTWPEYATAVRVSNDGGFGTSKTLTKDLAASIDWELDDSVKGIYTKVVYVRFNGVADTTKTYSDDIILDTSAPIIKTASAAVASSSVRLSLKATDDITGVSKVQIRNDTKTVTKNYASKISVPLTNLSLSASSIGVQKLATATVKIRVSDNAGNWTGWQTITVAGVTNARVATSPAVSMSKSATAKSIAAFAKISVPSTSKVSLKVVPSYTKYCTVSGTTLRGIKTGPCKVTVIVTPKKGKATTKIVTLQVAK